MGERGISGEAMGELKWKEGRRTLAAINKCWELAGAFEHYKDLAFAASEMGSLWGRFGPIV